MLGERPRYLQLSITLSVRKIPRFFVSHRPNTGGDSMSNHANRKSFPRTNIQFLHRFVTST